MTGTMYNISYVEGILGIPVSRDNHGRYLLTEDLKRKIEEEQKLYEGLLDSIASAAGSALQKTTDAVKGAVDSAKTAVTNYPTFAAGLYKIIQNTQLIQEFGKKTLSVVINPALRVVSGILEKVKNSRFGNKFLSIYNFLKQKINQIRAEVATELAQGGAKGVFYSIAVASIFSFLKNKLGGLLELTDEAKKNLQDSLLGLLGTESQSLAKIVITKIADIKNFMGWLGPLIGGVNFIVQTFAPVMKEILAIAPAPVAESLYLSEPPLFLLENMTKTEIKDLVKDEIQKTLKRMVEEELEKVLKDNKKVKNQIGDLSKEILKMLYKDLSLHHTYVIDRVKF